MHLHKRKYTSTLGTTTRRSLSCSLKCSFHTPLALTVLFANNTKLGFLTRLLSCHYQFEITHTVNYKTKWCKNASSAHMFIKQCAHLLLSKLISIIYSLYTQVNKTVSKYGKLWFGLSSTKDKNTQQKWTWTSMKTQKHQNIQK